MPVRDVSQRRELDAALQATQQPWLLTELRDDHASLRVTARVRALGLARALLGSKPAVQRAFERGSLTREGTPLAHAAILEPGDEVVLAFHRGGSASRTSDTPVTVLYHDPVLMAVDKPAGLLVHGDGSGEDTLTERVQGLLAREGRPTYAQAVQRLDVETTGVVLFSLTEEFKPALDAQMAGHEMHKRYLAVVGGEFVDSGHDWVTFDGPIARDRHDSHRMRVGRTGKPSCTRVRRLSYQEGRSLLLVELQTGRRHQIRVHLAHAGFPLVGDTIYGGPACADGLMLHALEEQVVHPLAGDRLLLRTAVPARFRAMVGDALA